MRGEIVTSAEKTGRLPIATGRLARLAYAHAKAAGIALEPLLKKANLTRSQIENTEAPIGVRDQIKFLNLVAEALNDDLLGYRLAQVPDFREVGLLYYVLASSDVLIDAMQRAARYSSIVNEGIVHKCIERDSIGMSFRYVGVSRHLDRHQIEFWIAALVRICRQLTGLRLIPNRVRLVHRRAQTSAFGEFFGTDVEFGAAADEVLFPINVKQTPIVSADPYLNKILTEYCEDAIAHRRRQGSFRSSVENAVAPLLPHGKARVDEVARHLGVSPRTFARRLSAERLTFSTLVDKLRCDLANRYLADGDLPISQIAWLLGYREVGSFSHAFKRWTGKRPREARRPVDLKQPA
ncbi:MAG TPA: AraC family transcriptional regulator ligand-binding domain-containing protein [Pseudolabrys sp.]|jgi:AraC-like DNA-binding protein